MSSKKRKVQKELEQGKTNRIRDGLSYRINDLPICGGYWEVKIGEPWSCGVYINIQSDEYPLVGLNYLFDFREFTLDFTPISGSPCKKQLSEIERVLYAYLCVKNEGETSNYANNARG